MPSRAIDMTTASPMQKKCGVGTDPLRKDTDDDGVWDGDEVNDYNSNPLNVDSDDGGLIDGREESAEQTL
jgi:hypothetical protein